MTNSIVDELSAIVDELSALPSLDDAQRDRLIQARTALHFAQDKGRLASPAGELRQGAASRPPMTTETELTKALVEGIQTCIDEGFVPPLYAAAVAVNGSAVLVRYAVSAEGNFAAEFLAEHVEGPGFATPVNIMLTDSRGEAARIMIGRDGTSERLN